MNSPHYIQFGETRFSVDDVEESRGGHVSLTYVTGAEVGSKVELLDKNGRRIGAGHIVAAAIRVKVRLDQEPHMPQHPVVSVA